MFDHLHGSGHCAAAVTARTIRLEGREPSPSDGFDARAENDADLESEEA